MSTTARPRTLAPIVVRQLWPIAAILSVITAGLAALLVHRYHGWDYAVLLREHVGAHAYQFGRYPDDAHQKTAALLADGERLAFQPALYAALCAGALTGREWGSRRYALTLTQSVSPRRWFTARWTGLALLFVAVTVPVVALYRLNAEHAIALNLLTHGVDRQTAYFTIGPVTVAYTLLGVAAGALTGTLLRRAWAAALAAPLLTWLLTALLVRSRAALLLDWPAFSEVHGMHPGGLLGLQFYDVLPTDSYVTDALRTGDYWPYQLAETALVLALAVLLTASALRVLRRRTGT
ncbi:hypothetical protein AB0E77_22475 [Streptomyces sp. NPDC032940]|uniref:hypothetical protein n=1 Tax=Streptomyces sp. NPDC032940 TaxID=3155366 RepID=UPI0033D781F1